MLDKFKEFLKSEGAWDEYEEQLIKKQYYSSLEDLKSKESIGDYVCTAFIWYETPRGEQTWSHIDKKWRAILKENDNDLSKWKPEPKDSVATDKFKVVNTSDPLPFPLTSLESFEQPKILQMEILNADTVIIRTSSDKIFKGSVNTRDWIEMTPPKELLQ